MEKGQLSREAFMQQIQAMTEKLVKKAKEYDRDTIPGDYATLQAPCPNCGGVVKENYRRYACTGQPDGNGEGCGFSFTKSPAGRTFETAEAEALLRERRIGPLEGFRSKAGWPFTAEVAIVRDEEAGNYKLEFDFGEERGDEAGEAVDFSGQQSLGDCPACGAPVYEHGGNYVCSKAVPTAHHPQPSCAFKSGKVILQQPVERAQMHKLLTTGKTDLLDKFISNRTRRPFKAFLAWDAAAGKVNFEFEQREAKYPPRPGAARPPAAKSAVASAGRTGATGAGAVKTARPAAKKAARKTTAGAGKTPSVQLAAVIGGEAVARTEATKKIWDYIKAHNLQDPKNKRTIVADDKLRAVFDKDRIDMMELAGVLGRHLG
jgi:DNA topoisomerase-3